MKKNRSNNSNRKIILVVALFVDIVVMFTFILIYLRDNRDNRPEIKVTDLPYIEETQKTIENIQITIKPDSVNSYLSNPGIGWQGDIHQSSEFLPETVAYSKRKDISWNILNPSEGIYDWTILDRQLSLAISSGKSYSFRVYTMIGESFGEHQVPSWVLEKGAKILPSGEPDYSNCVYQEEWGRFVQELVNRYDGNPDVAFIDISGYGNFNEWSWQDEQTEWDRDWEKKYTDGAAVASDIQTLDGQARRRLADMFIGGTFESHQCHDEDGKIQLVGYSYQGFKSTQLIMPFAGIVQSTQYVFSRRPDIGFRYDSLGRTKNLGFDKIDTELSQIWKNAPVLYEMSKPKEFNFEAASQLLSSTHASLVHNNDYQKGKDDLQELMLNIGYRYYLKQAQFEIQPKPGGEIDFVMLWKNVGSAPNYPKMGQNFELHVYLVDQQDSVVADYVIPEKISSWMPSDSANMPSPEYVIKHALYLPKNIIPGVYNLMVAIHDVETDRPINLAFSGDNGFGKYLLTDIVIGGN